jgi:hypothetical protein
VIKQEQSQELVNIALKFQLREGDEVMPRFLPIFGQDASPRNLLRLAIKAEVVLTGAPFGEILRLLLIPRQSRQFLGKFLHTSQFLMQEADICP